MKELTLKEKIEMIIIHHTGDHELADLLVDDLLQICEEDRQELLSKFFDGVAV